MVMYAVARHNKLVVRGFSQLDLEVYDRNMQTLDSTLTKDIKL